MKRNIKNAKAIKQATYNLTKVPNYKVQSIKQDQGVKSEGSHSKIESIKNLSYIKKDLTKTLIIISICFLLLFLSKYFVENLQVNFWLDKLF
jgi:hypothetical protein